jgi:lysophospholipase L1-like esterase
LNVRALLRDTLIVIIATLGLLALIEGGLRVAYYVRNSAADVVLLPYTAAQDWGVVPPWTDALRILEDDPVLLWRTRPGQRRAYLDVYGPARVEADRVALIQQFIPRVPASLRGNPVWNVSTNSRGFRDREFTIEKPDSTFRIVCLGDSWTFGANVDQEHAYPQRLAALLDERYPGASIEVLNLGVMGYSSRQGLELLRRTVLDLDPDIVVIGFAMNDAIVQGWRDRDAVGQTSQSRRGSKPWLERVESYKLVRYWSRRLSYEPFSIGDYLQRVAREDGTPDAIWTGRMASESADYDSLESVTRVAPRDYEQNLTAMIDLARSRGARVVLLFNELWRTPYEKAVESVAKAKQVPWVNSRALIAEARREVEAALEAQLGLKPAAVSTTGADSLAEVIFRVHAGRWRIPSRLYIAGNHPALGDGVPNRVGLHDDGTHGDQRPGDGVWSLSVRIAPGTRLFYVYTNSGREGEWEGVDVPDLRFFDVPDRGSPTPVYKPIETFGSLTLQADGWHTNAAGYALIARALADVVEREDVFRAHRRRRTDSPPAAPSRRGRTR